MKEILVDWDIIQNLKYNDSDDYKSNLEIKDLTVKDGIKSWNFTSHNPNICALFSNEDDNLNKILKAFAGIDNIISGKILLNHEDITYNIVGWERKVIYLSSQPQRWNKLFSVHRNLMKIAMSSKSYLQAISKHNKKIKIKLESLKNTGLNTNTAEFKTKIISLIKEFIQQTQKTRILFIKEYETQINNFHQEYANTKFNFSGSENLAAILIRKFNAEEENIIANNNLLFYQSLQDRISSLESLIGDCNCGCNPSKNRKREFQLREIKYILDFVNNYLEDKIFQTRKEIRTTLKSCNNHNQIFNEELNQTLFYKKITISRSEIDEIIERWVDLAEVQRIKFNMKQDFVSMQLLPDEMQLLLKNIKDEIKIYHKKLSSQKAFQDDNHYNKSLKKLEDELLDVRDVIDSTILTIFQTLELEHLLVMHYSKLSALEKRIIHIIHKLVVPIEVLLLENPFELLETPDKVKLGKWLKILAKKLNIIIFFNSKENEDIKLVASHICVIENEIVIQQGRINEISSKPLSLNLLKEMNKKHLNIFKGEWNSPILSFYDQFLGHFPALKAPPIVAVKPNDLIFSYQKPRFMFFQKVIKIHGIIKSINKFSEKHSFLTFQAFDNRLFEILVHNNDVFIIGSKGWLSIVKNTIYIFDSEDKQLIDTW